MAIQSEFHPSFRAVAMIALLVLSTSRTAVGGGMEGTLVVVGGGDVPGSVWQEFVALAGGLNGRLVVIPTATADDNLPTHDTPGDDRVYRNLLASRSDPPKFPGMRSNILEVHHHSVFFGHQVQERLLHIRKSDEKSGNELFVAVPSFNVKVMVHKVGGY